MSNWLSLEKEQQIDLFTQAGAKTGLPPFAIEKDAWVALILRMLFASELYEHIVFKGGTSLSKVYRLIKSTPKMLIWRLIGNISVIMVC